MRTQVLFIASGCVVFSIILIAALKFNSKDAYEKVNHFNRIFSPKFNPDFKYADIKYNSYYFAGISSEKIFLGNNTAPGHLLVIDHSLTDTLSLSLQNIKNYKIAWAYSKVYVDFPDFYLTDKISRSVLHGKLPSLELTENYNKDSTRFDKFVPISPGAFALRQFDTLLDQNNVVIKRRDVSQLITAQTPVLKKQIDGKFCTDGMLLYSPEAAKLIYLYYYRNQIICIDTSMNILYHAHTIDTVSVATIRLDTIHSQSRVTFSSPPLRVNRKSCVSHDRLYVHSSLIADNEDPKMFEENSVIDVYDLRNGQYELSFYIPEFKKNKMRDFRVLGKTFIAIYDHHLTSFTLTF